MESASPDFYTYLSQSNEWDANGVHEAQLAIIAGADTNAITISNICYLLCRHPEYQKRLYQELADLPETGGIVDDEHLVGKPYLLGIIHESLRLYPPVPTGVQRVTPPEGAMIAGQFIPGDMVVTTPTYSIQRGILLFLTAQIWLLLTLLDLRAFVEPDSFIPERWTTKPELVLRKDAFLAFGYGTYNCAGKPLAMMQLRMVLAMVIKRYEISFPLNKEADCQRFIEDQADCFTIHLTPLPLSLKKRV